MITQYLPLVLSLVFHHLPAFFIFGFALIKALGWRLNHPRFAGAVIIGSAIGILGIIIEAVVSIGMSVAIAGGFFSGNYEISNIVYALLAVVNGILFNVTLVLLIFAAFSGRVKNPENLRQ